MDDRINGDRRRFLGAPAMTIAAAPWERVVADAAPCDHIVQLYQDQDFLNCAAHTPSRRPLDVQNSCGMVITRR
jgi:hypothetical protein